MKVLMYIVLAIVVFFITGTIVDELGAPHEVSFFSASVAGIVVLAVGFFRLSIATRAIKSVKETKEALQRSIDDDDGSCFAQAEEELDSGKMDRGLWSKALVKAKGDETLRKVEYMKLRASQIKTSQKSAES